MAITIDNYESYLVQYLDGTLPEREAAEVEAFLESHPDLKEEMALFASAPKLEPLDAEEVPTFSNPAVRRTLVIGWHRYAAAACVLALFAAGLYLLPKHEEAPVVAKTDTIPVVEEAEQEEAAVEMVVPAQSHKSSNPIIIAEVLPEIEDEPLENEEKTPQYEESEPVFVPSVMEDFSAPELLAENKEEEIQVDYETFKRIANYDPLDFIKDENKGDAMKNDAPEEEEPKPEFYIGRLAQPFLTVAAWIGNVRNEKDEFIDQLFGNI